MANSAFDHNPSITVPGSSTNTALVRWSGTGGKTFLDSTILVGATTMGLAADTNLITFGNGTLTIAGTLAATTLTGSGAGITALNGSNIASGTVAVARLGSGSPGSGNFLRGDGSWQAASSALQSTVTYSSRTASAGSDNSVPYTGAGFAPTAVIIIAQGNTQDNISFGFGDDANAEQSVFARALGGTPVMERSGTYIINAINGSNSQRAALVSLDSGGMTLDWTKAGSGEAVNFVIVYLR